jgi:hypothetical protein
METESLVVGHRYAFREKRGIGQPMLKVKLLDIVGRGGKVKVQYEDGPHPGLEEYVSTRQLIVPWGERQAFLSGRVLPYGQSIRLHFIRCTSKKSGMRCVSLRSHHGFLMSRTNAASW